MSPEATKPKEKNAHNIQNMWMKQMQRSKFDAQNGAGRIFDLVNNCQFRLCQNQPREPVVLMYELAL